MGAHCPPPEPLRPPLRPLLPGTEGPLDRDSPRGTAPWVRGVQAAQARLLRTQEAASEQGDEAPPVRHRCPDRGRTGPAAVSESSQSGPAALTAVEPAARLQAAHCQRGTKVWGHRQQALVASRRQGKASGAAPQAEACSALAQPCWPGRWRLRKPPSHVCAEARPALAARASEAAGVVPRCRTILRPLGPICAPAHRAAQAPLRRHQRRQDIHALAAQPLTKMPHVCDEHWAPALRYLRKKGRGNHRRGANSESGMRRRRRRETTHEGIRSAATRQHDRQL
jgi:hypothetical protein